MIKSQLRYHNLTFNLGKFNTIKEAKKIALIKLKELNKRVGVYNYSIKMRKTND